MEFKMPKQLPDFNYLGLHSYTISLLAYFGRKDFESDENKSFLEKNLATCAKEDAFEVLAFAHFPSKFRFLVRGLEKHSDLRGLVDNFKRKTERDWRKKHNEPLWLPGYSDHVLRKKESIEEFVEAIQTGAKLPIGIAVHATAAVAA